MPRFFSFIALLLLIGCAERLEVDQSSPARAENSPGNSEDRRKFDSSLNSALSSPPDNEAEAPLSDFSVDRSALQTPQWKNAIQTAEKHMSKFGGQYSLVRINIDRAKPNETVIAKIIKIKKLAPEYEGGGSLLQKTGSGEFVFVEHIESAKRNNGHDPLVLSSSKREPNTVWIKVPVKGVLGVVGDIHMPSQQ